MKTVHLGSVAAIERQAVNPSAVVPETRYLGLEHIRQGGQIVKYETVGNAKLSSIKFRFSPEHVLFGKLRPNLGKISRPDFEGICSTDILPIRPGKHLDRNYFAHFLLQPSMIDYAASRTSGVNLPRLNPDLLANFPIPLPPLSEQRRIAAILDQADALRAKRRQVLTHLDSLIQAIFTEMFSADSFELVPASVVMPNMRNGVSPATAGTYSAQVLTLSAVTQGRFDPSAVKLGLFISEPASDKRVTNCDFLMCRGNGNKSLVGAGAYSSENRPDLVFPDTVIAGRVDTELVTMRFLESIWKRREIRTQIESAARTTNGTFKVNQQTLSKIQIPVPPIDQQRTFDKRVNCVALQRVAVQRVLASDDALFSSLQSRAFRGEL